MRPVRAVRRSIRICLPGKYAFRVIASNSDGVWNESAARLNFSVAPAYYETNWFRALCAMLLVLLAWAGYRLRVRQLHRQFEMTLDARVAERTRIARDLHDTLLQSFHGLLLRFQTASNLLPDRPAESKEVLASAIDQAAEAITEGRDAVQGLRDLGVRDKRSGRFDSCARRRAGGQRLRWAPSYGSRCKVRRGRYIQSCATRSSASSARHCATRSAMPLPSRSKSSFDTTSGSFGCGCVTTAGESTRRCCARRDGNGTSGCAECGSARSWQAGS